MVNLPLYYLFNGSVKLNMKRLVVFDLVGIVLLLTSALPFSCCAQEKEPPATQEPEAKAAENLYWVFLTTGKSLEGIERTEVDAMQAEHLNNFRRLAEEGKLLTAGPMSDPENVRRGIVVLKAGHLEELAEMFREDPYVKQGYMKVDSCKMKFELGKIHTRVAPKGMEELRIVVLERNPDSETSLDAETEKQTAEFLKVQYDLKKLDLSVRLFDVKDSCRHILFFQKQDSDDDILKIVNEIPAVKAGFWKQKTMPIFMGKGSIDREDD